MPKPAELRGHLKVPMGYHGIFVPDVLYFRHEMLELIVDWSTDARE
jgi:hypothetical protein